MGGGSLKPSSSVRHEAVEWDEEEVFRFLRSAYDVGLWEPSPLALLADRAEADRDRAASHMHAAVSSVAQTVRSAVSDRALMNKASASHRWLVGVLPESLVGRALAALLVLAGAWAFLRHRRRRLRMKSYKKDDDCDRRIKRKVFY